MQSEFREVHITIENYRKTKYHNWMNIEILNDFPIQTNKISLKDFIKNDWP